MVLCCKPESNQIIFVVYQARRWNLKEQTVPWYLGSLLTGQVPSDRVVGRSGRVADGLRRGPLTQG